MQRLITIVFVVLLVGGAGLFYMTHERVKETRWIGYQGEARYNNFKAAELLLEDVDIEAESHESLRQDFWLPNTSDTILIRDSSIVGPVEHYQLGQWAREGGHLIKLLSAEPNSDAEEFLSEYGLEVFKAEFDHEDVVDETSDINTTFGADEAAYALDRRWFSHRLRIDNPGADIATVEDEFGVLAIRVADGNGYVTFVVNGDFFGNQNLSERHHGRFLLDIVDGFIEPGKVWLVYSSNFPSLWQLIWQNAPYAVLGFFGLLVIALWSTMPKFGPTISEDPPVRRSILEHIRAAGTFVWKQRGVQNLCNGASSAVLDRAEARHPGISRLPPEKQARLIAELTGLDAQTVLDAITGDTERHHREFTQHMKTLQRIRKEL